MNSNDRTNEKSTMRPRGRMMDFSPRNAQKPVKRPANNKLSDNELRRRELAKKEIARREEIHRQIEEQKEKDLIAKRRAIAARKDLARRLEIEREANEEALAAQKKKLEMERERAEMARRRELAEKRAMAERRRLLAERRARQAREELEARRKAESKLRIAVNHGYEEPKGSKDPIARKISLAGPAEAPRKRSLFKRNKVETRLGSVEDFEAELNDLEREAENAEPKEWDDVEAPEDETIEMSTEEEIEEITEEDIAATNNNRYVLGGRSPFINTEVEKRPLSGGSKTFESTASAVMKEESVPQKGARREKPAKTPKGRFVPYNEPIPHKNIYARTVAKEKDNKDVPTMVMTDAPKTSKVSLIIAIILTVILGATVGAIAYLALFQ